MHIVLNQRQLEDLTLFGQTPPPMETPMTNEDEDTKAPDCQTLNELEDRRLLVSLLELRQKGLTRHCQALVQAEGCLQAAEALMAKAAPAIRELEKHVARDIKAEPSAEAREPKPGLCIQVGQQRWELITARPMQYGRSTMIGLLQEEIHGRLLSRSELDAPALAGMVAVPLDELMRQGIIKALEISTK